MKKLLIANRGEIALRIIATARRLGIATVSVYSEADIHSPHVRAADESVFLGEATASQSYLNISKLLAACAQTKADAVHPGYGFLSESPEFAEAVLAAGLCFVGPTPSTMRLLGHKDRAREAAIGLGIPVIPGYDGETQEDGALATEAERIGVPLLIKAAAGGGGKGMRLVRDMPSFQEALLGARREAESFFGNGRLLLEKKIEHARHIEVQVIGDGKGSAVHVFERDCSLQRRYQKVVEETPAAKLTEETAQRIRQDAVRLASHVQLSGVATIEFLVGQDASTYYFLEANPRLQVEHPVTEMVTGIDLVEQQLRIASGQQILLDQTMISRRGAAVEVRIYAENPWQGFLPRTGVLSRVSLPPHSSFELNTSAVRIDHFLTEGASVSAQYDPLLAKVIAWGEDRERGLRNVLHALASIRLDGIQTNIPFLIAIVQQLIDRNLTPDTSYIDTYLESTLPQKHFERLATTAACLFAVHEPATERMFLKSSGIRAAYDPFIHSIGWRANSVLQYSHPVRYKVTTSYDDDPSLQCEISYKADSDAKNTQSVVIQCNGQAHHLAVQKEASVSGENILLFDEIALTPVFESAVRNPAERVSAHVLVEGQWFTIQPQLAESNAPGIAESAPGAIVSPLPGKVLQILTAPGKAVTRGEVLILIESMKMEHRICAAANGWVREITCSVGANVSAGAVLLTLETKVPAQDATSRKT